MKKASFFYVNILLFICTSCLISQDLVSHEFLKEESMQTFIDQGIPAQYDIEYYKITYTTPDVNAVQDTASGLLILPKQKLTQYPMIAYMHGTVPDRNTGMSNLAAADVGLAEIYASLGFVTVAPDYLGMNESRGFHPYMHAKSEASAGRDMMYAVRSSINTVFDSHLNGRTFITGYSQGGHAAMALHKELEENNPGEFDILMSLPMSGPYSISEKMIEFTLGDTPYFFVAYLPNVFLSYKTAYSQELANIELEDTFLPEYIDDIRNFENGTIDLFQLNTILINKLTATHGASIPKFMIKEDILDALFNDPDHPLSMALADNDLSDWTPQAWVRMYYCEDDDQVTYENTLLAEEQMLGNGAPMVEKVHIGPNLNHTQCVTPSIEDALFTLIIRRGIISSTTELLDPASITVGPNPGTDILNITLDASLDLKDAQMDLINYDGKSVRSQKIEHSSFEVPVDDLQSGLYLLEIKSPLYRGLQKVIIQ